MVKRHPRLIPTTEKGGLATPLWSDNEFSSILNNHMDSIVSESVRQNLTQKFGIDPDRTWTLEECKKVLGACVRKNNTKGIIFCYKEYSLALAAKQTECIAKLEKKIQDLCSQAISPNEKIGHDMSSLEDNQKQHSDVHPDLQSVRQEHSVCVNHRNNTIDKACDSVKVCGARKKAQSENVGTAFPSMSVVQLQDVAPETIDRLAESLPSAYANFSEFRGALSRKIRLYDLSLANILQLMSQILSESEFSTFETAVKSYELQDGNKDGLREGVLAILRDIVGPKVDWTKITSCVQRKNETVSEYTERFCQSAAAYSGIANNPEDVLNDKGPLVRTWFDGLSSEYRNALPFLDLTWSNATLRSNLNRLTTWERDSDVKTNVKIAAALLNKAKKESGPNKCLRKDIKCHYCGKQGHYLKECRKGKKILGEINSASQLLQSLLTILKQPLPSTPNLWGNLLRV